MKKTFVLVLCVAAGYFLYHKYAPAREPGPGDPAKGGGVADVPGKVTEGPPGPVQLFQGGRFADAIEPLRAELKELQARKSADAARDLYYLGVALEETKKPEEATTCFAQLERDYPKSNFTLEYLLGRARGSKTPESREQAMARLFQNFPQAASVAELANAEAERCLKEGREWDAWLALSGLMRQGPTGEARDKLKARMEPLVKKFIFSAEDTPNAKMHVVQPKELLGTIAKRYGVPVGLIQRTNHMDSDRIFPNQRLKIVLGQADIEVKKDAFRLTLYLADRWIRDFKVGIGIPEASPTPEGVDTIANKSENPVWFHKGKQLPAGDPENILGTRWMAFKNNPSYGIHGTTLPETVGTACSNGCVRMRNEEVEFLYDMVNVGTRVSITK